MDIFDLFATLSLDSSKYEEGLNGAETTASSAGGKIGKALGTMGKVAGAALATAATGVTALVTASTNAYANYQQLVGGIDTLFEDLSWDVRQNAARAFDTAGLSMNEYMETAMSFAASLNQSLQASEGNIARAAEMTDKAIIDMADNANKMGTSMESIQNAYQGFAKQNYTMLDNLKLGYGGTQSEMKRLIEDAEKLDDTFTAMRDENGDLTMSFADIVNAIHIVQDKMGITNTTAEEAAGTISGSLNSVKSAWQNLIVGIADENADFGKLMDNLVTSASAFISNIIPRIEVAIGGVSKFISGIAPVIAEALPKLVSEVAPALLEAAMSLIQSLASVLPQLLPVIVQLAKTLVSSLMKYLPDLLDVVKDVIISVVDQLAESAPIIISTITEVVVKIVEKLLDNLPLILDSILEAITKIADYILTEGIPKILEKLPEIIVGIVTFIIKAIPKILSAVIQIVNEIVRQLPVIIRTLIQMIPEIVVSLIPALIECIPDLVVGFVELFSAFTIAVPLIIVELVKALPEIISGFISAFKEHGPEIAVAFQEMIPNILSAFSSTETASAIQEHITTFFTNIGTAISGFFTKIGEAVEEFFRPAIEKIVAIWNWFDETFGPLIDAFKELISTVFQAIQIIAENVWNAIVEKIKEAWDKIWEKISPVIEKIKGIVQTGFQFVHDKIKEPLDKIKEKVRAGFEYVYDKIKEPLERAKTAVSNTLDKIKETFQGLIDKAKSWGLDLINNFIAGIQSKIQALTDMVRNVSQTVKDFIGFSEPKKGPLSNFHTYAPDMMDLFMKGINDNKAHLQDTVASAFDFKNVITEPETNAPVGTNNKKFDVSGNNYYTINVNQPVSTPADMLREIRTEAQYGLMIGESLA
jgi:phage-related protein